MDRLSTIYEMFACCYTAEMMACTNGTNPSLSFQTLLKFKKIVH